MWLLACLALLSMGTRVSAQLDTAFSPDGLTSLQYGGTELLADGSVGASVILKNAAGMRYEFGPVQSVFDPVLKRRTITYPWGSVAVNYVTAATRLNTQVTVTNNSADAIVECAVTLMTVHFPSVPAGAAWAAGYEVVGLNTDDITALAADYGTGLMLLCNDQPGAPLKFGFESPNGLQQRNVRMTTAVTDCPDDPQIAPHTAAQYFFSMRFAASGTDAESLVPDLHAALRALTPPTPAWADGRAIGTVFLASAYHASATNPRGWLNEPTLDTITPSGLADFRVAMLARADEIVARLGQMNAQGMIFWNVEGEQYPYITYAGDPRVIASLAPEMHGIADEFFAKFISAGLRTGVCLRPSRIVPGFPGNGHVWDHDNFGFDVLANLSDKITYAKTRWGCTLFYIDSNVDWIVNNYGVFTPRLLRSSIYAALHALHPDVLIIPEIPRTGDWASAAPYREINSGDFTSTRARSHAVYPQSRTIIEPKETDWIANHALLVDAVREGGILLFRCWYSDPPNVFIKSIYEEAHPPPMITSAGSASGDTGAPFSYTMTSDSALAQFSAISLPAGLALDPATGIISGTPLIGGNITVTLRARGFWGIGEKTLTLALRSLFDQWRTQNFPGLGNTGNAASTADPDGDSIGNLLEFALGLNPLSADPISLAPQLQSVTDAGSTWPAITFRRRTAFPAGVNYIIEESTDLTDWQTVDQPTRQIGVPVNQGDGTEAVTIRGTHPIGMDQWFLRLRVSEQ